MVWSENFHFKPFPGQMCKERDRQRERREISSLKPQLTHSPSSLTCISLTHSRRAQPLDPLPHGSPITELHPLFVDRTAPIKRQLHRSRRSQHHADHTGLVDCGTGPIALRQSSTDCTGLVDRSTASIKQRSHWIWWIFFWVLFLLCSWTEKWYYIFVWKLRKCEQQVENVLCIVFLRTQQTLENIFQNIFWNATKHLKIFSFPENSIFRKYFT